MPLQSVVTLSAPDGQTIAVFPADHLVLVESEGLAVTYHLIHGKIVTVHCRDTAQVETHMSAAKKAFQST